MINRTILYKVQEFVNDNKLHWQAVTHPASLKYTTSIFISFGLNFPGRFRLVRVETIKTVIEE